VILAASGLGESEAGIAPLENEISLKLQLFAGFFDQGEVGDVEADGDLDGLAAGEGVLAQVHSFDGGLECG
jgi:hypothetical protein